MRGKAVKRENGVATQWLDEPRRGPGGHWLHYRAWFVGEPKGPFGYGDTALEATKDLRAQRAKQGG